MARGYAAAGRQATERKDWGAQSSEQKSRRGRPGQPEDIHAAEQAAVVSHAVAGQTRKASERLNSLLTEYKECKAKPFFHQLIRMSAAQCSPEAACWCFEQMCESGVVPNLVSFNILLNACAQVGNIALADHCWEAMADAGVTPNSITYNIMINACARGNDATRAGAWVDRMIVHGIKPSRVTLGAVVHAYAKTGRLAEAEDWAARIGEMGLSLDRVVFNSLLNASVKAGDSSRARFWFEQMRLNRIQPDEKAYSSLIHAAAKSGDLQHAQDLFDQLEASGSQPDMISYSSMVYASVVAKNAPSAEQWMERMIAAGVVPNDICFNTLMQAFVHTGDVAKAEWWTRRMEMINIKPGARTFNGLINVCLTARDVKRCQVWLKRSVMAGVNPSSSILKQLQHFAPRANGRKDSGNRVPSWACEAIAEGYISAGKEAQAEAWLRTMGSECHQGVDHLLSQQPEGPQQARMRVGGQAQTAQAQPLAPLTQPLPTSWGRDLKSGPSKQSNIGNFMEDSFAPSLSSTSSTFMSGRLPLEAVDLRNAYSEAVSAFSEQPSRHAAQYRERAPTYDHGPCHFDLTELMDSTGTFLAISL
mmetsp:Transcript_27990/g.63346  ORF Transcript_27990/g.63346 Transcript_27990/m.63346 type:complete len:589 (-) Transcript_27990:170-1936(-)